MMIDFALEAERGRESLARPIYESVPACVPAHHDDTMAALLGGLPLALGQGVVQSCAGLSESPSSAD